MVETLLSRPAAAGECIVVYSTATGRVRRWSVSDQDGEIFKVTIGTGEAFLSVSGKRGLNLEQLQQVVNVATGKIPIDDRYVVVKGGVIINAILADPACEDSIPDCELIAHPVADERWGFDTVTRVFSPPVMSAEELIVAARALERVG